MRRAVLTTALCFSCADIQSYGADVCGNNVVEPDAGEDCDLVVDEALGDDLSCGPADGSARQCRYVCDGAECPRSWACGDDGICRPPSGRFEAEDTPAAVVSAQQFALVDIEGDEDAELVARLEGDLFVFGLGDVGYAQEHALTIPNARGDLAFADVDGDDRADLLLPAAVRALDDNAELRLHALRSDGERLVTAIAPTTPTEQKLAAIAGVPTVQPGVDVLLRVFDPGNGRLRASAAEPACARPTANASLGIDATGDVPPPPVAALFADARPHAAVAVVGGRDVHLIGVEQTCGPDACDPASAVAEPCAVRLSATQVVRMPSAVVEPGCRFVDTDADRGPDLVCHVTGGIAVALARDTTLADAELDPGVFADLADLPALQARDCAPVQRILAARDLTGDGRADVVTPHGVFEAIDGGYRRLFARTLGDGWGEAVVGDVDRDGRFELVATLLSGEQGCAPTRLQALEDTGGAYSEVPVQGVSAPQRLRIGDFDGDGLDDLGLVASAPGGARATVLFGDTKEPLEDEISVGNFGQVSALTALRAREGTEVNDERLSDLAIASGGGAFLTVVTGTTKRSLLSPLPLPSAAGRTPVVVLAGSLAPREVADVPPDVLTVAPRSGWLVRGEDLHHGLAAVAVPIDVLPMRTGCSTWAVGPAEDAGGSLVAGVDGHAPRNSAVVHGCDLNGPAPVVVVGRFEGTRAAPSFVASAIGIAGAARAPTRVNVFDFDGTTVADVVVHFAGNASLQWLSDPVPGVTAGSMMPLLPELTVLAAATIDADADEALELAVLTPQGVQIVDHDQDTFVASDPRGCAPATARGR